MVKDGYIKVGGRGIYYTAEYEEKFVDDSFSHEFGVEKLGHYEVDDLVVKSCIPEDDDDMREMAVSDDIKESILQDVLGSIN